MRVLNIYDESCVLHLIVGICRGESGSGNASGAVIMCS